VQAFESTIEKPIETSRTYETPRPPLVNTDRQRGAINQQFLPATTAKTDDQILQDEAKGLNNLGVMFLTGIGANHDLLEAFNFFELGANAGNNDAMNNLGRMYERGWGTPANWKKAAELYADAARKGNRLAQKNLERLSYAMSIFNRESTISVFEDRPISDLGGRASANKQPLRSQRPQADQNQAASYDAVPRDAPDSSSNEQNRTTPRRSKAAPGHNGRGAEISRIAIGTKERGQESVTGSTGSISSQKEQPDSGIETDKSVQSIFEKKPVKNEKRKPRREHEADRVSRQSKLQTPQLISNAQTSPKSFAKSGSREISSECQGSGRERRFVGSMRPCRGQGLDQRRSPLAKSRTANAPFIEDDEIRGVLPQLSDTDLRALRTNCAMILSSPERFPRSTRQICVEVGRRW
jgi:Sel1 repeat